MNICREEIGTVKLLVTNKSVIPEGIQENSNTLTNVVINFK